MCGIRRPLGAAFGSLGSARFWPFFGDSMILRRLNFVVAIGFLALGLSTGALAATPIVGTSEPEVPSGQFMSLSMKIDDTKTTFTMTGPDFSWFAFGFDTTTMFGYSVIVEGTDGTRTVIEQNLQGIGSPGGPQATQNASIVNTIHDAANDLTTVVIERLNNTGDPNDAVFSTSMTTLDIIAAYDSFSSPEFPSPSLSFHGSNGQAFGEIIFTPVPEPATIGLTTAAMLVGLSVRKRRAQ